MRYELYPCQAAGIEHAVSFLKSASPGDKQLYSGPTGVGKSIIELEVQRLMGRDDCAIVTPRTEIIDGMLEKEPTAANIWTPITLRNRIMEGAVKPPRYVIFDETHHHEAESWQELSLLTGLAPMVGYTASPYRGSPKSTRAFREHWGEPIPLITYPEAIAAGYISMPSMSILPLVDDDIVDVSGGEFEVTSLEAATVDRLGDLAEHSRQWYDGERWTLSTLYAMPGTKSCELLQHELAKRGLPSAVVSCYHSKRDRPLAFDAAEAGLLALIHVNVVQEGVDRKFRRLVDCAACMSPVKWVQQFGRIMRPWDGTPEYICCNRNVLRHAYILEGIVPSDTVAETERVFGPTQRAHKRVLGMEAIGRFKPSSVDTLAGPKAYIYRLEALIGNTPVAFTCIVPPAADPIWASRVDGRDSDDKRVYGKWCRCNPPEDLRGFASRGGREPTKKQLRSWKRNAVRVGLSPEPPADRRALEAMFVLMETGERV